MLLTDKYTLYNVDYKTIKSEYVVVSDINSLFEHNKDTIAAFNKIDADEFLCCNDFIRLVDYPNKKAFNLFYINVFTTEIKTFVVIAENMKEAVELLTEKVQIKSVEDIGTVRYKKSDHEFFVEMESKRIG